MLQLSNPLPSEITVSISEGFSASVIFVYKSTFLEKMRFCLSPRGFSVRYVAYFFLFVIRTPS